MSKSRYCVTATFDLDIDPDYMITVKSIVQRAVENLFVDEIAVSGNCMYRVSEQGSKNRVLLSIVPSTIKKPLDNFVPMMTPVTLTLDDVMAACKNIGYDLSCGGCAAVFFTGTGAPHTCKDADKLNEPLSVTYGSVTRDTEPNAKPDTQPHDLNKIIENPRHCYNCSKGEYKPIARKGRTSLYKGVMLPVPDDLVLITCTVCDDELIGYVDVCNLDTALELEYKKLTPSFVR